MDNQEIECINENDDQGRPAGGSVDGEGLTIRWQNGPLGRVDDPDRGQPNGAFVETVIRAAKQRIEYYQGAGFACEENDRAITYLGEALKSLSERTKRRVDAGTEGTHEGN